MDRQEKGEICLDEWLQTFRAPAAKKKLQAWRARSLLNKKPDTFLVKAQSLGCKGFKGFVISFGFGFKKPHAA